MGYIEENSGCVVYILIPVFDVI